MQAGKSGLTLLPPCSSLGEADLEAVAANPQEDGACGHRPLFLGSAFVNKVLVSSDRKFEHSTLLNKAFMCVERHGTHPHIIHGPLPELVGGLPWMLLTRVPRRHPFCIG
jgi:hypothetical protein